MRTARNPCKSRRIVDAPPDVTVGVLNCLPELIGYSEHGLDVLRLCLASIRCNTKVAHQLLVADNGSCSEVQDFLLNELRSNRIDRLILNKSNIGEANGVAQILRNANSEYVVYSDGDIFHRPNWLERQIEVAQAFDNVGVVGGRPLRNTVDYFTTATKRWVESKGPDGAERGKLIPESYLIEFVDSLGIDINSADKMAVRHREMMRSLEDIRVRSGEVQAYVGASHMQFLLTRPALDSLALPWSEQAFNKGGLVDGPVDAAGFLRLSVVEPMVDHIGNAILNERLQREAERILSRYERKTTFRPHGAFDWLWRQPAVNGCLRGLYSWAFKKYVVGARA